MNLHQSSLTRRLTAAAILATGFGTLWFMLVIWVGTSAPQTRPGEAGARRETLAFTTDGTPLIQSVPFDNLSKVTYRDLNGHDSAEADGKHMASPVYLYGERETIDAFSRRTWQERIKVFMDEREPAAVWYFVHDGRAEGSGEFVGYERVSNRLIGYIGLAGFRARPVPPSERIPVRGEAAAGPAYWSSVPASIYSSQFAMRAESWDVPPRLVHVPSGSLLRLVDLAARTTTIVFEAPAPITSVGVPFISTYSGSDSKHERPILVRAGEKIYKLDHAYKTVGVVTAPAEVGVHESVTWYEADDGRAVVECSLPGKGEGEFAGTTRKTTIYLIATDGTIESSTELTLSNGMLQLSEQTQLGMLAVGVPAPAFQLAIEALLPAMQPGASNYATRLGDLLRRSWPWLAGVLAVAVALAAVARRRADAFGLSRRERNAWAAFVLILGAPGFVGFLLHRHWPTREPCPHCHASVPRDRAACAACGTPFPAPALKGTEIFA